jgi:hypothetical protein
VSLICLIIAIVLFLLNALEVAVSGINLLAWGFVFFAASFLPWRGIEP